MRCNKLIMSTSFPSLFLLSHDKRIISQVLILTEKSNAIVEDRIIYYS